MEKVLLYIDGQNLFMGHAAMGIHRIDIPKLVSHLVGERHLLRAYYYSSLPSREDDPMGHDKKLKFFEYLNFQERMEVRAGSLKVERRLLPSDLLKELQSVGGHIDATPTLSVALTELENRIRTFLVEEATETKEKGVDIQIAVDMLDHAHRELADVQILVSGDGDFIPLVAHLKSQGVNVEVAGPRGSVASGLRSDADKFHSLNKRTMISFAPQSS
ncbi:NYN domain-containing protein [bacterium]|nr:NYN domain-containing protein [bacterium]